MTSIDEQGRPEPPAAAGELDTLLGFLEFQRATLEWKTRGLDAAGLSATVGASSMSLGGLLKHLAHVEDIWFSRRLLGNPPQPEWADVRWQPADWDASSGETPEQLRALWQHFVELSRARVAEALADGGLDRPIDVPWPDGTTPSLRWVIVHMIEEYSRHNGHADLLRESVDGETGE